MEAATSISPSPPPSADEGPSTSSSSTSSGGPSRFPEVYSEEERDMESPELIQQQSSMSYRVRPVPRRIPSSLGLEEPPADDTLSCVIVILTFWFFVSMTLIMGIFGSENIQLGPYSSILLRPNPLFVNTIKVEVSKKVVVGPMLYGFYKNPPLENTEIWSESMNTSIKQESHKEWIYYLNKGSQINISYNVASSSSLLLIVAKGIEGLAEWLEDPSYPDSTLSWNVIHGSGSIRQDILRSYDYYVAVGNLNSDDVEVELNLSIRSSMHDTADSYFKCNLTRGWCNLKIPFPGGNAALLTTPGPLEGNGSNREYVKLSYEPRWMTYFLGGMTSVMLWAFNFLNRIRRNMEDSPENQSGDLGSERAPLLSQKDDELSSLGSSYDSGSQNDEETQEDMEEGCRRLCVICFDAPKDCFFIPCGHCATCFTCGIRIAEVSGTCPICRRRMKKVRRIYTV
ncbi:E3 ubiquitin-protein ligase APD2 isoform X2 [Spinacia oleracea]|uniref:E3 ubiquitin-protein ligase APD2 isoform X2 n=1 Tax=Spinacia oleracea TaxID=3562 RepID=A0A9R0I9I5_SPIOL|nr:E3 ubiquitin-protein ligase APD2 isoform X2 [Spinacia oleracea]